MRFQSSVWFSNPLAIGFQKHLFLRSGFHPRESIEKWVMVEETRNFILLTFKSQPDPTQSVSILLAVAIHICFHVPVMVNPSV